MSRTPNSPVYVVLGATGGIGTALARQLAAQNAKLVIGARQSERCYGLAQELDAECCIVDATRLDEVEACVQRAAQKYGYVTGIANCVGSLLLKPLHMTSEAEWDTTIETNLRSAFVAVRAGVQAMMKTGGAIVLCSTAASLAGFPNHEAIAAAKAGINGLTLSAAATYASRSIRVNAVAPGLTRTPLTARLTSSESALKTATAMHALQRIGEPEEVASAIAWLLDPKNSWITGQILAVDGGLSALHARA